MPDCVTESRTPHTSCMCHFCQPPVQCKGSMLLYPLYLKVFALPQKISVYWNPLTNKMSYMITICKSMCFKQQNYKAFHVLSTICWRGNSLQYMEWIPNKTQINTFGWFFFQGEKTICALHGQENLFLSKKGAELYGYLFIEKREPNCTRKNP